MPFGKKRKKFSNGDLARLCIQWALLTRSAVPIDKTLGLLCAGINDNPSFKKILLSIRKLIIHGYGIAASFYRFEKYFPPVFLSAIKAGEEAGNLEASLKKTAQYLGRIEKLKKEVGNTLIYPLFTLFTAFIVMIFMLVFIVPSFAEIYSITGSQIPAFTKFLINLGENLNQYFFVLFSTFAIFVYAITRADWQNFLLKTGLSIPGIRTILQLSFRGNFSYAMWILLSNGIPLVQALQTCKSISALPVYRREIALLLETAKRGVFFEQLRGNGLLRSPILNELIKSGQHSAHLDEIFASLAEYYGENFENLSKKMLAYLEPALILFLGIIIGSIVVSLYIPIFEISTGFSG